MRVEYLPRKTNVISSLNLHLSSLLSYHYKATGTRDEFVHSNKAGIPLRIGNCNCIAIDQWKSRINAGGNKCPNFIRQSQCNPNLQCVVGSRLTRQTSNSFSYFCQNTCNNNQHVRIRKHSWSTFWASWAIKFSLPHTNIGRFTLNFNSKSFARKALAIISSDSSETGYSHSLSLRAKCHKLSLLVFTCWTFFLSFECLYWFSRTFLSVLRCT